MGTGIHPSFKASGKGGFLLAQGGEHIRGLFAVALDSGDSANPFQEEGLGEWFIFDPMDLSTFAPIVDRIKDIAEGFGAEELMSLQKRPDNLKIIQTAQGEAAIAIYVIDLETDNPYTLGVTGSKNGLVVSLL